MLTLYYGDVGSGKTMAMIRDAKAAYERGEPVYANIDIDVTGWNNGKGGQFLRWYEPIELIGLLGDVPLFRCGLIVFDELGAIVNNRESDYWPFMLTIKLIEHRKDHLDIVASAQVDDMADKNMRRFYNVVFKCTQHRIPLIGLFLRRAVAHGKRCPWPECNKNGGWLYRPDRHTATLYRCKDIDPRRTANINKHGSKGSRWFWFDRKVAESYDTAGKVSAEAKRWHEKAVNEYDRRRGGRAR